MLETRSRLPVAGALTLAALRCTAPTPGEVYEVVIRHLCRAEAGARGAARGTGAARAVGRFGLVSEGLDG